MPEPHSTNGGGHTLRAVAYYRVSTNQQETIPEQRAWAKRCAAGLGFRLASEHADEGIPGDRLDTRPALQALLSALDGRTQAVLCWDTDRLSRAGSFEAAAIYSALLSGGCWRVVTSRREYDLRK